MSDFVYISSVIYRADTTSSSNIFFDGDDGDGENYLNVYSEIGTFVDGAIGITIVAIGRTTMVVMVATAEAVDLVTTRTNGINVDQNGQQQQQPPQKRQNNLQQQQ